MVLMHVAAVAARASFLAVWAKLAGMMDTHDFVEAALIADRCLIAWQAVRTAVVAHDELLIIRVGLRGWSDGPFILFIVSSCRPILGKVYVPVHYGLPQPRQASGCAAVSPRPKPDPLAEARS